MQTYKREEATNMHSHNSRRHYILHLYNPPHKDMSFGKQVTVIVAIGLVAALLVFAMAMRHEGVGQSISIIHHF